jgi:carbon monoxide dehydrogenase subunit G
VELSSAVRIGRPAAEVFDALLDAGTVAACLPGCRLIGEVADGTYAGQIELRIGPIDAVYAGTVRLDTADRNAGTVTLRASGRERAGQGRADAYVAVRVEPDGASARVLISADLMIRGLVAQYAPGAIGEVSQRLAEQFAGNVERLLAGQGGPGPGQADAGPSPAGPSPSPNPARAAAGPSAVPAKRAAAAAAALLGAGLLTALAVWRMRSWARSLPDDPPTHHPHGGASHA